MISISMPLYISVGVRRKNRIAMLDKDGKKIPKNFHFNLNNYRNWHYQVSNNLKIAYKDIAEERLVLVCVEPPIRLHFILWKKDKRKVDRANVLSIHEKFFCDALVELNYIPDDNDDYITSSHYYTGGIDKINPRVEIWIEKGDANDGINFVS